MVAGNHDKNWSAADMDRVGLVGEALVWWLSSDPRVQRAYLEWRLAHGLLPGTTVDAATLDSIRGGKERDLAVLDRLVRDDLKLDYAWLAPLLLFDFGATVVGEGGVRLIPEDVGLPAGRRPKGRGEHHARDVEWFYRAKIKTPPDTVYKIAKEHATREKSASVWHSVVQNGIKRAKRLLAVLDLEHAI